MGTEGASLHRASSPSSWADGRHSVLGCRVFTQGSAFEQRAWPQRVFAALGPYGQQAVGWHSVFWQRASSRVAPWVCSWQLVGIVRQQYSSYDLILPPGLFQPRGQSDELFPSVVCWCDVLVFGRALDTGRHGHRAGLVTGCLGHCRLGWAQGLRFRIGCHHLRNKQLGGTARLGTDSIHESLPALFRISLRSLPWRLSMSVVSSPRISVLVQVLLGACAAGSCLTQRASEPEVFSHGSSGAQLAVGW